MQPAIAPNKPQNSITIRATPPVVAIFEKLIQQNDKPRAEVVVDVEIMEVSRTRVKAYGLNLTEYAVGAIRLRRATGIHNGATRRRRSAGARSGRAGQGRATWW